MDSELKMRPVKILLVEDNPAHSDLAVEALQDAKMHVDITVVDTGEKALAYLYKEKDYENEINPDLILLDLNLPGIDGREVLFRIKEDPHLKCLPVVILTTSEAEEDILSTYNHYANCYIKKPVNFDQFYNSIQQLTDFWFTLVKLPTNSCDAHEQHQD